MKNCWYSDNRDLIKWSILIHLAFMNSASRILHIAYFQEHSFPKVELDYEEKAIPREVQQHFRDIKNIENLSSPNKVRLFDKVIIDRNRYVFEAKKIITRFIDDRCVVFLDPDTGLEPKKPSLKHVLRKEANEFWENLKLGDVFVFYQHQTNKSGEPWEESKRVEFEKAIGAGKDTVKIGRGPKLAKDVVLFYAIKA
jgi:hypothetical protein